MIVSCGESLVDMLPTKTTEGADAFMPVAGGTSLLTATTLGRLGEESAIFTGLSSDFFGDIIIEALTKSNVSTSLCNRVDKPTTLSFITLRNANARYVFVDENTALRNLKPSDIPALPDHVEALYFGGISLIYEPCASAFELMLMQNTDKVLFLDPDIRPNFVENKASLQGRIQRMSEQADIIRVTDADLAWLSNEKDPSKLLEKWLDVGVKLIIIGHGSEGVEALTPHTSIKLPAKDGPIVDKVGSGLIFNGGFLSGLRRNGLLDKQKLAHITEQQLIPVLELALQAEAISASREGPNPPWAHEINLPEPNKKPADNYAAGSDLKFTQTG